MDGILNVYKEKGYTSHDVVAKLRGILRQKKIGHTGTLDPEAEGVLPVCLGNATKVCELLTEKEKQYEAVLQLGITTDTQDMTGVILKEEPVSFQEEKLREAISSFLGAYDQLPPMYSAIKVDGKRLYELAREGKEIERSTRRVVIHDITILEMLPEASQVRILVDCSKGTYIRTLCQDIGERLGCGGCMAALVRTRSGNFLKKDSLTLEEIRELAEQDALLPHIVQVPDLFPEYGSFQVEEEQEKLLYNGNPLGEQDGIRTPSKGDCPYFKVYDSRGRFLALYAYEAGKHRFKPYKMFL